jgi:energy-coupling factor transporter ATP-binding protein EcfA2
MVLPIAALLPVAGAAIGGITGYRQSGGDIGSAALGAGLGAMVPGGFRMAGQALGAGLLGRTALGKVAAAKAAKGLALSQADKALLAAPAAAGLAAGGLGLLATPSLAGAPAAGLGDPARTAASAAAGMGIGRQQPSGAFDGSGAVPGGLPVGAAPYNPLDVASPTGPMAANRLAGLMEGDVQLENMKKMMPYLFQAAEARSKTEMQRQLAAAGVRQNIVTAANMLERSQQAAQQMGLNAASQAGSALTSQYQYQ